MKLPDLTIRDTRTITKIYNDYKINDSEVLSIALEGGKRIPISNEYDKFTLKEALQDIAERLTENQMTLKNILNDRPYSTNSVHHFESLPKETADLLLMPLERIGFRL